MTNETQNGSWNKVARVAAEWWANQVCNGKFDASADSAAMSMAEMLATMTAAKVRPDAGVRAKFVTELERRIIDAKPRCLSVDYGPDRLLSEAGNAAGVDGSVWPWKTTMWLTESSVTVRAGYRAEQRELEVPNANA